MTNYQPHQKKIDPQFNIDTPTLLSDSNIEDFGDANKMTEPSGARKPRTNEETPLKEKAAIIETPLYIRLFLKLFDNNKRPKTVRPTPPPRDFSTNLESSRANFFGSFRFPIIFILSFSAIAWYYYTNEYNGKIIINNELMTKFFTAFAVSIISLTVATNEKVIRKSLALIPAVAAVFAVNHYEIVEKSAPTLVNMINMNLTDDSLLFIKLTEFIFAFFITYKLISMIVGSSSLLGAKCINCGSRGTIKNRKIDTEHVNSFTKRVAKYAGSNEKVDETWEVTRNVFSSECTRCLSTGTFYGKTKKSRIQNTTY
jgi:hypothetical protein